MQPPVNDPLHSKIKGIEFKFKRVADWSSGEIQAMINDRSEWHERRKEYMPQFDNLMRTNTTGPWPGSANFNVPVTMWMLRQMHARIMAALIGDDYGFTTIPREKMDRRVAETVDQTMRWAVTSYANEWKGIGLTIDDWVWDVCKEGWGVLKDRWEIKDTKVALTEEDLEKINRSRGEQEVLESMIQIIRTFDGPCVEALDHEAILFPGDMEDGMDLNQPDLVAHLIMMSEDQINSRVEEGLWDRKIAEQILKSPSKGSSGNLQYDDMQRLKESFQGVKTISTERDAKKFPIYECFARYDVDNDGFSEDVVFYLDPRSRLIPRWTTLDRVSPKLITRPLHKVDFIRRQRRSYGIGMAELLYSIQREVNAMHNQRIDFGTIASIPFFFFKPGSGMKKEKIHLEPGMGVPLDNPATDVNFPKFNTNVLYTKAEEAQLITFAEKLLSLPPITNGQSPSPAGPTMHATGFVGLLNEIGVDFDVVLKHFKFGYESTLEAMHANMEFRMPKGYKFRVLGSQNQELTDEKGETREMESDRFAIAGNFDFKIKANSRTLNREAQKQDAMAQLTVLMNPLLLQTGIVTPYNLYNGVENALKKRGELECDLFITKPGMSEQPLTTLNEIVLCTQGEVPRIVLNDDHGKKVEALTSYMNSNIFLDLVRSRSVAPTAPEVFKKAIARHQELADSMGNQAGMQNATGSQMPLSMGARMSGEINQQTGQSLANQELEQAEAAAGAQASAQGTAADINLVDQRFGRI